MAKEKTLEQVFLNKINALTIPKSLKSHGTGLQAISDMKEKIKALRNIQNSEEFKSLKSSVDATGKSFYQDVNFILFAYNYHGELKEDYDLSFFETEMPKSATQMSNNLRDIMSLKTNLELLEGWYQYEKDLFNTKSDKNSMNKTRNKMMGGLVIVAVIAMLFFPIPALAALMVSLAVVYSYNYYKTSQLDKEFLEKYPIAIATTIDKQKNVEKNVQALSQHKKSLGNSASTDTSCLTTTPNLENIDETKNPESLPKAPGSSM
jgi:hypothetical protein